MNAATEPTVAAWPVNSPIGGLVARWSKSGLASLSFDDGLAGRELAPAAPDRQRRLEDELARYFAGEPVRFRTALAHRGTEFQRLVWDELVRIPFGETRCYAAVAAAIGRPSAVRAVARANGANPIAILVPCHRVIAADGSLTGYAAGLDRKRRLLDLERGARWLFA